MRTSRRELESRNRSQAARIERLLEERDAARRDAHACAHAIQDVAGELSRAKDVVASHIIAAGHPSHALHAADEFAAGLRQALTDAGVDLHIELDRSEGAAS